MYDTQLLPSIVRYEGMTFEFAPEYTDSTANHSQAACEHEVLKEVQFTAHDMALSSSEEARTFLQSTDALALTVLPLALVRRGARLVLHMAAGHDTDELREKLRFLCGIEVSLTSVPEGILAQAIPRAYFGSELRLRRYLDRIADASQIREGSPTIHSSESIPEARGDAAQFLTAILEFAAVRGASDLHLSPGEKSVVAKMRIDGELCSLEKDPYAKTFHEQVVTRVKVLAALDVTNRRLPQDGAFRFVVGGTTRSARVSTLPSVHGESLVVRFLDGQMIPEIGNLGIEPTTLMLLRGVMDRTEGLILLTGPTGSGKTTTMYSVVRDIARRGRHVVTAEDPVENPLPGAVQVQVCVEQGLDYPRAIRSVLRHDPDVLLIGEMRDRISASMALDAASTGHLTVSSLHVGSSLQAINRLEMLGVPRSRSIPSVSVVVNQRLIPKLCSACREKDSNYRGAIIGTVHRMKGCNSCAGSGFRGRVLVTEVLDLQTQRAKDACYRASTTRELLDILPTGAFIPWTDALQYHLTRGDISMAQIEQFAAAEML